MTIRSSSVLALTIALGALLWGCGPSANPSADNSKPPPAASGTGKATGALDVAVFQGGYGLDFFEKAAKEYEQKHPGTQLTVWGNPRVWEQLRQKFLGNTPPDLSWPGWGFPYWPSTYAGQFMDLNQALDGPAYDGKGKWRDTFEPALLKLGQYEGKQFMMPYHFNVMGWWYDPKVFADHGWTPPKTWSELMALGPKIKAAGMAPLTYQGQYPYYMSTGFLFPWLINVGGVKALDDAQSLVPGAWKSPAMLEAVRRIKALKDAGFFMEGSNSLSHTQAQTAFLNHKAAMIPCGTWLPAEMSKSMPEGSKMAFMMPPVLDGGKDPTAVGIGIEPWVVPSHGKNPELAIDFYKYMTSLEKAKEFVKDKGTLMSIKGANDGPLPELLQAPAAAFNNSKAVWSVEFRLWYPKLGDEEKDALKAVFTGDATPEQFCDRMEAKAEEIRKDSATPKHTYSR